MAKIYLNIEAEDGADLQATLRQILGVTATNLGFAPNTGSGVGGTVVVPVAAAPVEAEVQAQAAAPAETLSLSTIEAFLDSDPRYTQRSMTAIIKHFSSHDEADVRSLLRRGVDNDVFELKHRRRDGEALYSVASHY